jgi:hypothetical protein
VTLGKTPWVDKNMALVVPRLRGHVPDSWLPRMITEYTYEVRRGPDWTPTYETTKLKKPVVEEYGCGSYGCVMPTSEPGLVIKLTSDVSEAWFIARARTLGDVEGIVLYKKIFALPTKHKGRPLFVLWRTEARYIGDWSYTTHHHDDRTAAGSYQSSAYSRRVAAEADTQLGAFIRWARIARAYIHPMLRAAEKRTPAHAVLERREEFLTTMWKLYENSEPAQDMSEGQLTRLRGIERVGVALRTCLYISQAMQGNPSLVNVGAALGHYLENGILLADVHYNNLGLSMDPDASSEAIITDPGHAVEFNPRWAQPPQIVIL